MTETIRVAPRAPASPAARRASVLTVLRHPGAMWRLLTDRRAPKLPRVLAVLVLAYAVFPFDAVPDVVPVLGWLDDLGLVSLAIAYVASAAARYANGPLRVSEGDRAASTEGPPGAGR